MVSFDLDRIRRAYKFTVDSYDEFSLDGGSRLSAAMAYYILFVMAPAAVLLFSIASYFGRSLLESPLIEGFIEILGEDLAALLNQTLASSTGTQSSAAAGVFALIGTLWALGIFYIQMQSVFNHMWRVTRRPGSLWRVTILTRLRRFAVMLVPAALLAVGGIVTAMGSLVGSLLSSTGLEPIHGVVSSPIAVVAAGAVSFAVLYKFLPDAHVRWRYALWVGVFVSFGWSLGTYLFGLYLSLGGMASAYGAAGAVFVLLIWLNYSARLVLVGAKATKRWTELAEGSVTPMPNATLLKVELDTFE